MKKLNLMLVMAVAVLGLLVGCSTTGKLVRSSSTTVEHAMQGWAVWVVDGHATPEQELKVKDALREYYLAEDVVLAALQKGDKPSLESAKQWMLETQQTLLNLISAFEGGPR